MNDCSFVFTIVYCSSMSVWMDILVHQVAIYSIQYFVFFYFGLFWKFSEWMIGSKFVFIYFQLFWILTEWIFNIQIRFFLFSIILSYFERVFDVQNSFFFILTYFELFWVEWMNEICFSDTNDWIVLVIHIPLNCVDYVLKANHCKDFFPSLEICCRMMKTLLRMNTRHRFLD